MKKILVTLLAAFLVAGLAGPAAADYFDEGNLMQAVYTSTQQILTDVSNDSPIAGDNNDVIDVVAGLDTASWTMIHDAASVEQEYFSPQFGVYYVDEDYRQNAIGDYVWGNYEMGIFAAVDASEGYFMATSDTLGNVTDAPGGLNGAADVVQGFAASATAESYYQSATNHTAGYDVKLNLNQNSPGAYGGLNPELGGTIIGEINLGAFDDPDGWQGPLVGATELAGIYLYEYGSWDLGPVAELKLVKDTGNALDLYGMKLEQVPVPGAVLLFGTGLLGFFGIRRKNNA